MKQIKLPRRSMRRSKGRAEKRVAKFSKFFKGKDGKN